MAKGFGKVVLISSLIAGAAVGSLAYLKKEGIIGNTDSVARDIADKVSADAADIIAKERNYVNLTDEGDSEEAAKEANEENVKEDTEDTFEPGIKAENIEAADVNTIGSSSSEEFFNDEEA